MTTRRAMLLDVVVVPLLSVLALASLMGLVALFVVSISW